MEPEWMDGWAGGWLDHLLRMLPETAERKELGKMLRKPGTIPVDSR